MVVSSALTRLSFAGLLFAAFAASLVADPGFGSLHKRKIDLAIRQPAVVRLANTSFAVTGSSTNPPYVPVQESLTATLETELISNEHTLVKKSPADAEWVLGVRVTGYSLPEPRQRSTVVGNNTMVYVHWDGSLHVAYQVLDHGGHSHDAGNVESTYDKELPAGAKSGTNVFNKVPIPGLKKQQGPSDVPQTLEDVKQILIREVVKQIATKLGNTKQTLEVQVAAGDDRLNRAADFMEKRLWSRALEELEKMPEFPRPDHEAYRQYDLGLAYEAMSYDAANFNEQRENLFKAAEYYDKALEMNQKEKYFIETVARTKEAIARYKAFEGMQKEDRKKQPAPAAPAQPVVVSQAIPQTEPAKPQAPVQAVSQPAVQPISQPTPAAPQAPKPAVAKSAAPPAPKQPATAQSLVPPAIPSQGQAAKAPAVASKAPAVAAKGAVPKPLTITDVIEMFASGVPEDQITAIIQRSPQVQFDAFDKDTAIAIAKAKLPVRLQNEMRKKVGAPLLNSLPAKK